MAGNVCSSDVEDALRANNESAEVLGKKFPPPIELMHLAVVLVAVLAKADRDEVDVRTRNILVDYLFVLIGD